MNALSLHTLSEQLKHTLQRDRHSLSQRLRQLKQRQRDGKPIDQGLAKLHTALQASCAQRLWRAEHLPRPQFPEELPVSAERERIAQALLDNQVIVVAGETGSGKTTQLPKICLQAGRGVAGLIGCTQPRRIAARSIAGRIAAELETGVGDAVGYKVRFHDRLSERSYIKLMTDGILLAEIQQDRFLNAYDTLIIDEAHERSLNIDFLLGYLKQLLPKRRDLKLIITSATIDTARFAAHFDGAPVIEVSGRTYPVEVRYRPPADEENKDKDMQRGILDAVDEISRGEDGDILIFLPGERDIRETAEALRKHHPPQTEILPLYARLSSSEQDKVFKPGGRRRIVLATNVAETSLTVPRIRAVVDPGLARISRYSVRSKVQRLLIENISQASANQRKGRCGRIGPGLCIRLYSEDDFMQRPEYTPPEILRSSLAAVILRMLHLGLGDISRFPFVEAPTPKMINDGFKLLEELGAVDNKRCLTRIGRQLAPLPIDPRIGRMILAAEREGSLREVLIIAAALSVPDPRERPLEAQQAADQAHAAFRDEDSDFLSFIKLWDFYQEQAKSLSKSKLRKLCKDKFIAYLRVREWIDIHQQLHTLVREHGWQINQEPATYGQIHRALLTGLLGNLGLKETPDAKTTKKDSKDKKRQPKPNDSYLGARGIKWLIFPGSGLAKKKPKWLMAAELTETSRLFARCVAKLDPTWIEAAAGELCKRSYSEPHWEKRSAQVAAFEQVTLYGLTIVVRRKINFGAIDPGLAREVFIRAALVNGEYYSKAPFFLHNQKLIAAIEDLEHKARRPDILVDEEQIFAFFDAKIPAAIHSGAGFERWRKQAEREQPQLLFLSRDDLMQRRAEEISADSYPDQLQVQDDELPLRYQLEPGQAEDGVSADIPVQTLNQLQPGPFEWLIPGLLEEKITELIRGLPKALRKNFVPVPDVARAAAQALEPDGGSLLAALGQYLQRISGVEIPPDAWNPSALPAHLQMNFRLLDSDGNLLAQSRDLEALQSQWRDQTQASFARVSKQHWERDGLKGWDCGDLPEVVELEHDGLSIQAIPALVDAQSSVALRLFDDAEAARRAHRLGLLRLFLLQSADKLKAARKQAPVTQKMCLQYSPLGRCDDLKEELLTNVAEQVFLSQAWPRTAADFQTCLDAGRREFFPQLARQGQWLEATLDAWHDIAKEFKGRLPLGHLPALDDIRAHIGRLVYAGFLRRTPLERLRHLPRYLKAARLRLDKLQFAPDKDAQKAAEIEPLWARWRQLEESGLDPQRAENIRWLLEELHVSLFAQELKTADKVSIKRLEKLLREE